MNAPRTAPTARPETFSERLWPSPGTFAGLAVIAVGLELAFVPLGPAGAAAGAALVAVLYAAAVALMSPRITCDGTELRVARARIALHHVREVHVLPAGTMATRLGPELDARAHLCVRGWIRTGVRVDIDDPDDPVPYWLLSVRDAQGLADTVQAAHSRQTA